MPTSMPCHDHVVLDRHKKEDYKDDESNIYKFQYVSLHKL